MGQKIDRRIARWSVCVWMLLSLTGCGDSSGRQSLEGTVTLDGAPLTMGHITFVPQSGTKGPIAGGKITEGQFFVSSAGGTFVGKFRVNITATRKTGRTVVTPMFGKEEEIDETEQFFPPRYNRQSELTAEVTADGRNRFQFALSSQR